MSSSKLKRLKFSNQFFFKSSLPRFVCVDTIEMQILKIQANKMDLATSSLTGAKKAPGSKLTIDDLKSLFGMNE